MKMTRDELMEYKRSCGARAAADLLLLIGPDAYDGDYDSDMMALEAEAEKVVMK